MKKFISLFIAALIIGGCCFAFCRWVLQSNNTDSLNVAVSMGLAGLVVEYLKAFWSKKQNTSVEIVEELKIGNTK